MGYVGIFFVRFMCVGVMVTIACECFYEKTWVFFPEFQLSYSSFSDMRELGEEAPYDGLLEYVLGRPKIVRPVSESISWHFFENWETIPDGIKSIYNFCKTTIKAWSLDLLRSHYACKIYKFVPLMTMCVCTTGIFTGFSSFFKLFGIDIWSF